MCLVLYEEKLSSENEKFLFAFKERNARALCVILFGEVQSHKS